MGDEGMTAGDALCYLLQRDGLTHWLSQRRRLHDVYFGRDYTNLIDKSMAALAEIRRTTESPVAGAARRGSMPANLAQSMSDAWSTDRAP